MARIEKGQDVKKDIEKSKGEVIKHIKRQQAQRGKLTCSIIFLVVFFGFISWIMWVVASTGLIKVPVFTSFAYDRPVPVRYVEPGTPIGVVVDEAVKTILTKRLQAGNGTLNDSSVTVVIKEEYFTSTFKTMLEQSSIGLFDQVKAQVAISEDGGIELFIPFKDSKLGSAVTVVLDMHVLDKKINVEYKEMRTGSLKMPKWLSALVLQPFVDTYVPVLNNALSKYTYIDNIEYKTGEMVLTGTLDVEILPVE